MAAPLLVPVVASLAKLLQIPNCGIKRCNVLLENGRKLLYLDLGVVMQVQEDRICSTIFAAVEALNAPFFCSGTVPLEEPVVISYRRREGSGTNSLKLPGASTDEIQDLASRCSDATFGREEGDYVYDPSYRKSLKLDPANFSTSFELSSSGILDALQGVLVPQSTVINAELRRLNLYRPGDFFKPHVETPRQGVFAALVVVLPCEHIGGELLIQHNESLATLVTGDDASSIRWAAFYSDCIHEVKQLKSGYRWALSYSLISSDVTSSLAATIDPSGLAVYQAFAEVKSMMSCDLVLGFPCEHVYPLQKDSALKTSEELEKLLKGADALVVVVAKCAGLKTEVREVEDPELKTRRIRCAKRKQASPLRPSLNEPNTSECYRPLVILVRIG